MVTPSRDAISLRPKPARVGVGQRARDFACDAQGVLERKLGLALELPAQRLAGNVRDDIIEVIVRRAGVEQRQNMRMRKVRDDPDLAQESLAPDVRRQLRMHDLEGDRALVLEVGRQIHGRHAAAADLAFEAVAAFERAAERFGNRGMHHS